MPAKTLIRDVTAVLTTGSVKTNVLIEGGRIAAIDAAAHTTADDVVSGHVQDGDERNGRKQPRRRGLGRILWRRFNELCPQSGDCDREEGVVLF